MGFAPSVTVEGAGKKITIEAAYAHMPKQTQQLSVNDVNEVSRAACILYFEKIPAKSAICMSDIFTTCRRPGALARRCSQTV